MRQVRDREDWPQIIHRMWHEAQAEHRLLVIDRSDGDCFVIRAGPIATFADAVEFVDEQGSKQLLAYAEIVGVVLTTG